MDEEIGVKVRFADLVPLGTRVDVSSYRDVSKREIANVYFLRSEIPLTRYHVDTDEIEGLVEIEIETGMQFFSGKTKRIVAKRARWHPKARRWRNITTRLDVKRFVPKMDSYYLTLFIMAKRFLSDEEYLSI